MSRYLPDTQAQRPQMRQDLLGGQTKRNGSEENGAGLKRTHGHGEEKFVLKSATRVL